MAEEIVIQKEEEPSHINILPRETVGQVLRELSVMDRFQCEGVNRRWKSIVWDLGWTEQKKLSYDIVFNGATDSQKKKFNNETFVALFRRVNANLTELDLKYFPIRSIYSFQYNIFGWIDLLLNLEKLDVSRINFREAVYFLPRSLIELRSSGPFTEENLKALAHKCPHLESIQFDNKNETATKVPISVMNEFFGRCQNLKTINLMGNFIESTQNASLTALGQIERLEEIDLDSIEAFGDAALKALIAGCPRLKSLKLNKIAVSEEAISELDQHPNLIVFETFNHPILTGDIEMEINGRWKIKKYNYLRSRMSTNESILLEMLNEISPYLDESRSFIDELIQFDLLPLLTKSLNSTNSDLQLEAVCALATIADGRKKQTDAVVEAGAVQELLKLLGSENDDLREQSLRALANINRKAEFRDLCIDLGIIERLLQMVEAEKSMDRLRLIVLLFEKISQNSLSMDIIKKFYPILPVLGKFVQNNDDEEILESSIWTLANIADEGNEQIQLVIDLGVVPRLVSLADNSYKDVQLAALFSLANIAKGTEEQVQLVLDLGLLKMIPILISEFKNGIGEQCVRFLGNIASNEDRVQTVVGTGLVLAIVQILVHCWKYSQNEGVTTISNIAKYGRSEHVHYLVDHGVISPLCSLLRENDSDNDLVLDIFVVLKNILEKSGTRTEEVCKRIRRCPGSYKIWNLHYQRSEDIKKVAGEIRKFFPPRKEEQSENDDFADDI